MKFKISGDKQEILEVCKQITEIKETRKDDIKEKSLKVKTTEKVANSLASVAGTINLNDAFDAFVINYYEDGDDVILDIPFYVPKFVRFILKRSLKKSFEDIFKKSCEHKVKVKFLSWK